MAPTKGDRQIEPRAFDGGALRHELTAIWHQGLDDTKLKLAALEVFDNAVTAGRGLIEERFGKDCDGTECATALSDLQDELIRVIYDFTVTHVYRAKNPSNAERISIVAQGGYGRGTLAPGSDIDLLFLLPYKQTPWGESVVE
ncbi:MAG: nucleotidyltransferase domain-containing protein, partial [Pseudomonadota bacterium]